MEREGRVFNNSVAFKVYLYADDIILTLAHKHQPTLHLAIWEAAEDVEVELRGLGLSSSLPKSEILAMAHKHTQ